MDMEFVAQRITRLRMKKNVSQYQMSCELGRDKGYIQNIVEHRSDLSMREFFCICEYLSVSPSVFFDEQINAPEILQRAIEGLKRLNRNELEAVGGLIDLFNRRRQE